MPSFTTLCFWIFSLSSIIFSVYAETHSTPSFLSPSSDSDAAISAPTTSPLARRETNADRMRRGLGPKRPKRLHNPKRHLWARHHGASPTVSALPTPTSTPDCTSYAGMIGTTFFSGTGELVTGFLSKSANVYGEYRFAQDVGDALLVSFCVPSNGNKPFDITTTNGISNFPYLAAVQGFASSGPDLPAGSSNYAYITGSSKTHPGVTPGTQSNALNHAAGTNLPAQSAIWTLNTNDNSLTANYVNSDKSTPTTTIELVPDSEAFIITGDPSAFNNEYGDANPTTFTFIPA